MSATTGRSVERTIALCAATLTSTHFTVRTAMPLLLSGLAGAYGFSDSQLGDIGAAYSAGATVIALSAPFWLRWVRLRSATAAFAALGVASLATAIALHSVASLMAAFALAGIGFGGVYSLMIAMITRSANPDRAFGWQWGLGSIPGVLLLYALPLVSSHGDMTRPLLLLLGLNTVTALSVAWLPKGIRLVGSAPKTQGSDTPRHDAIPIRLALCAVATTYLGITGAWSFLDRVATEAGLTSQYSGAVLAITVALSSLLALTAGQWGHIGARRAPMTGAFLTMMTGLFFVSYWPTPVGFAAGSLLFLGLATCVMTFTLSLVARLDVTGKAAALPAAALGIGSIVGPAMAGHVYQAVGVHGMIASCALSLLVATAAYRSAYPTR